MVDFVPFVFGIVSNIFPRLIAPLIFDHALFAEEIGAFQRAFFFVGFEDQNCLLELHMSQPKRVADY